MTKVVVSDNALRELVREALGGTGWSNETAGEAKINPIVDPSCAMTDPVNPSFTPQNKTEFGVAMNRLVRNLPDSDMPVIYDAVKKTLDQRSEREEISAEEQAALLGGNQEAIDAGMGEKKQEGKTHMEKTVERALRSQIRKVLVGLNPRFKVPLTLETPQPIQAKDVNDTLDTELDEEESTDDIDKGWDEPATPEKHVMPTVKKIPMGVHGGEFSRRLEKNKGDLRKSLGKAAEEPVLDDTEEPVEPGEPAKSHSYKSTALGGMTDVGGASFEDIAKELEFSVAGAKQAVDKALEKAKFMAGMDEDDKEILVLTAMGDYVKMLAKSGELTAPDIQLMKDHPSIVRDLDGFREFLHNFIRRARKEDQQIEDPLGEGELQEDDDEQIKMKSVAQPETAPKSSSPPVSGGEKTKAKSGFYNRDIEVDWNGMEEGTTRGVDVLVHGTKLGKIVFVDGPMLCVEYKSGDEEYVKDDMVHVVFEGRTAASVAQRKASKPELYCPKCLWMTGGGACPRHGGPPWTKEREAEARAKSRGEVKNENGSTEVPLELRKGAPDNRCRTCHGSKKVRNTDSGGEAAWETCPDCKPVKREGKLAKKPLTEGIAVVMQDNNGPYVISDGITARPDNPNRTQYRAGAKVKVYRRGKKGAPIMEMPNGETWSVNRKQINEAQKSVWDGKDPFTCPYCEFTPLGEDATNCEQCGRMLPPSLPHDGGCIYCGVEPGERCDRECPKAMKDLPSTQRRRVAPKKR